MRVIAGKFKGRSLNAPSGREIRPTSDRLRETLFNILAHGYGSLEGARVLDLFAGTGALGIEAVSRGAGFCLFVDQSAEARGLIRSNVETLGLTGITKIYRRDAAEMGVIGVLAPFDILFCDPPYNKGLAELALQSAAAGGWIKNDALAVVEENVSADFKIPDHFEKLDARTVGDSLLYILKFSGG